MGILRQVAEYLNLKKKDPDDTREDKYANDRWSIKYVKSMHRINRLSIFLFLAALIFIVIKLFIAR